MESHLRIEHRFSNDKKFNFSNPESLIYQNDLLKLTALGGVKLEGLDKMQITVWQIRFSVCF